MSRAAALLTLALALGCGKKSAPSPVASSSAAPSAVTSVAKPPEREREPLSLQGSSVQLMPDESALVVADEDHEVLYWVPASLTDHDGVRVIALPGPPAAVVALDGRVLVTIRTLAADSAREAREKIRGPLPTSAALETFKSTPGAPPAKPERPPKRKRTPAAPFDPNVVRKSQGGLLLVMAPDPKAGLVERGRVVLAPDAWGLAVTPDKRRALVTSAWAAEVTLVDLTSLKSLGSAKTAREPRGIAILPDGKSAYLSHLVGSALTRLELRGDGLSAAPLEFPPAPARTPVGVTLGASLGYDLVLAPDAETLYVPRHALGAEGTASWWGAPSVDVLDLTSGKPLAPVHQANSPAATVENSELDRSEWLASAGQAPAPELALVQPRAVRYRRSKDTLLVAGEGSDVLVELDAMAADPAMATIRRHPLAPSYDVFGGFPERGGAPNGVALTRDENSAYVYCRSTFDLIRVELDSGEQRGLHLAEDGLPADAAYGRRLFTSARPGAVSGGIGCAGCHPEGRDDGYVWREGEFAMQGGNRFVARRENLKTNGHNGSSLEKPPQLYPRQTPMLAGRMRAMGPFGWHGQNKDILERLLEGFALHRGGWESSSADRDTGEHVTKIDYIADYLRSGLLPPPTLDRPLAELELRGKAVFESETAMCSNCHVPRSEFTDRQSLPLPPLAQRPGFDREENAAFKTPSLWFVGGSAPYFHDGSRATLEELVRDNGDRMGRTSQLNEGERDALVAYLKVL